MTPLPTQLPGASAGWKRGQPKAWDREPLRLGSVRIRRKGHTAIRVIKVTYLGPVQKHWMPLARWWWIHNKGPVPEGQRVVHLNDGKQFDPDELPKNAVREVSSISLQTGGEG